MDNEENQKEQTKPLFRQEALQAKKGNYFGKTLIVTPISFMVWAIGIFSIAVIIGLYLYFGEYAKRQSVDGVLVPDKGLINIYAKNPGVVVKRFVNQGDVVKKGDLLYLISTEQEALTDRSLSVQQVELLEKQIEVQKNKIAMYEKNAAGYEDLLKQHYISELEYQKRQDEYLTAKLSLHNFEKELNQAKGGVEYAIRAPEEGTISMLITPVGDRVTSETLLGAIVPKNSQLEGQLFVPTSKAGFVKVGQKVLLKYKAYPYQRFGLYEATVNRIDKSILNPHDMQVTRTFSIPVRMEEAFYRVTVTLQQQTVNIYGKPYPLTAGMIFDGVILGEQRSIWQWIFEPIYSLKGTL